MENTKVISANTVRNVAQGLAARVAMAGAGGAAGGAGMMSGLAAVGSVVGGGAVAAGVGYGAYKIWQWLTSEE